MYLLKTSSGIVLGETVRIRFGDRHRTKRFIDSPIGPMREIETIGVDKSRVCITIAEPAVTARGNKAPSGWRQVWQGRIMGTRDMLRVVAADDMAELVARDKQIAMMVDSLSHQREQRELFVKAAWRRATPVLSATAARMADEQAAAREDEYRATEEPCVFCGEPRAPHEFADGLRCNSCAETQDDSTEVA